MSVLFLQQFLCKWPPLTPSYTPPTSKSLPSLTWTYAIPPTSLHDSTWPPSLLELSSLVPFQSSFFFIEHITTWSISISHIYYIYIHYNIIIYIMYIYIHYIYDIISHPGYVNWKYHEIAVMAKIKDPDNTKCWWGCRVTGILIHCFWEYYKVYLFWKTVW